MDTPAWIDQAVVKAGLAAKLSVSTHLLGLLPRGAWHERKGCYILKCAHMKCDDGDTEKAESGNIISNNHNLVRHTLLKFISPILRNHGVYVTDMTTGLPETQNKPVKWKVLKLQK